MLRRFQIFHITAILIGAFLIFTTLTAAKGNFTKVVIYGQGVALESFDSTLLNFDSFNSFATPYPGIPSVSNEGYLIVRLGQDQETGEFIAFDSLRLFPTSHGPGSKPYIYYEGLVNGWSEYDRQWFEAKPEAAATLQLLLSSGSEQPTLPRMWSAKSLFLAGLLGIAVGMFVMTLLVRRRSTEQVS